MKLKMITAGIVLVTMLALCFYAMWAVHQSTASMRNLSIRATAAADRGDFEAAEALLGALQRLVDEQRAHLEVLALHEDLNEVSSAASEARVWIRFRRNEEFSAAMACLMESLTLLDERQRLTWSNLF